MTRLVAFFLCLAAFAQEPIPASTWRLTLDLQRYDGDYQPVFPYTLQPGETVRAGGDLDGTLGGFTLSLDRPGSHLVSGLDLSLLAGSLDGNASYSGTFAGETDIDADLAVLDLRARHQLGGYRLRPYLFLGLAHREQESREEGIVTYLPLVLDLPVDRRVDSRTTLLQPGAGVRAETLWRNATIGCRAEATFQLGYHHVDASEGTSPDDGTVTGYRLLLAVDAALPLSDTWSLTAGTGLHYQDWFADYDELQPHTAWFLAVGVQRTF